MSDKDSEDDTSSSSEEEEPVLDESSDKNFFKTLSCLKKKDPIIYNPDVVFFPKDDNAEESSSTSASSRRKVDKPIFLRDYEREQIIKAIKKEKSDGSSDDDDDHASAVNSKSELDNEDLPYAVQQKSLKASLKAALEESDSEDEGGLLKLKNKTSEEQQKEEEEYKAWLKGAKDGIEDKATEEALKPLHDYWSKPDLDPNEQFLRDYILNRRYLEEDEVGEDDGISEDGELLEMQEQFENDYNMRFENENKTEVKRFPRVIEGSLRRKDESRKAKRREKRERKLLEKGKRKEEISKNQKKKLLEFKEHIEKIKKLTGNDQLGFKDEEIFGDNDFDPEKHDAMMEKLYSDAFYAAEDDMEKPDFVTEDVEDWVGDDDFEDAGPDNMDLEAVPSTSKKSRKETRSKRKRKEKKKADTAEDILDIAKPVFDPNVHGSVNKYIDEYYSMDCEDFIEDIPCRFKYKQVIPNDYGLTVEEILAADDKELNKWVPARKITKLKPDHVEKNEVKVYRQKAHDFDLKKKILASVYGSPERDDDEEDGESSLAEVSTPTAAVDVGHKGSKNVKKENKNKRKREAADSSNVDEASDAVKSQQNGNAGSGAPEKKKKKTGMANQQNSTAQKEKAGSKSSSNAKQKPFGNKNKKLGKGPKKDWTGESTKKVADPLAAVSDLRLKAYDIKPREFKKKLKYKKQ
ncbi:Protein KRI1 homolog [Nesidiocoris tenuis]|uniref:Protein KRI1 homolog n=1 Tax=Nesidiocoris tenuis TaxID=355587 RepID=A0ABN7AT15_9HEMI|nr:Protein KRI1 homolog [Nesidiocoris tenuis]